MQLFKFKQALSPMKHAQAAHYLIAIALLGAAGAVVAQDRIFRCAGNEYTNNAQEAASRGCKPLEGGNISIVTAVKPPAAAPTPAPASGTRVASAAPAGSRIDTPEQKSRDNDARAILESELKKIEAKQADLLKEYNNGQPEKRGNEFKNHQTYLDRTAEMKAQIARNDSDIASIRRELGRTAAPATSAAKTPQ